MMKYSLQKWVDLGVVLDLDLVDLVLLLVIDALALVEDLFEGDDGDLLVEWEGLDEVVKGGRSGEVH